MDTLIFVTIILFVFQVVYGAWEIFYINGLRKDKATFIEAHSWRTQAGEGIELVAYVLAGILLYLSDFNVILVGIIIAIGIYHVGGTVLNPTNMISKMSEDTFKKMTLFGMLMSAIEVIFSIYVITTIIPLL